MATVRTVTVGPGRDYASLAAAISAEQKDLVALDRQLDIECYAFEDTSNPDVTGFTTDATRYVHIYTPASERHTGKVDLTKYRLRNEDGLRINNTFTRAEGMLVIVDNDDNTLRAVSIGDPVGDVYVSEMVLTRQSRGSFTFGNNATALWGGQDVSGNRYFRNIAIIDWDFGAGKTNVKGVRTENHAAGKTYAYNMTANVPNGTGFLDGYGDTVAKNCLATGCADGFSGSFDSTSNYNASDLASDAPGSNSRNSQTFSFVNAGAGDFHLSASDAGARGFGTDLSADANLPFSIDIDGQTRSGAWDIGADQAASGGRMMRPADGMTGGMRSMSGGMS